MKRAWWIIGISLLAAAAQATPVALQSMTLGQGPTIVVIHNLGGSRTMWLPTVRKLTSRYRVVLVDLPGHGSSPMPDPFSLDAGAEAIAQVLAAQKAESTIVVGQGMGALMALLALEAHPERARGLVAVEMTLKKQFPISEQQRQSFLTFMDQSYDFFLKQMFYALGRDSAQSVALHAQAMQVPQAVMKAYVREMVNFDPSDRARKARTPMLLLATDRIWSAAKDSSAFAALMGYDAVTAPFTLRHIPDCGVMVATERPDTLAALISGFAHQVLATKTAAR